MADNPQYTDLLQRKRAILEEERRFLLAVLEGKEEIALPSSFVRRKLAQEQPTQEQPTRVVRHIVWEEGRVLDPTPPTLVGVRLAGEDRTHLGLLLGNMAAGALTHYDGETQTLGLQLSFHNPAMYVPALNRIVWGYESWWEEIGTEDQLRQISNEDIDGVWYVQALKMLEKSDRNPPSPPDRGDDSTA